MATDIRTFWSALLSVLLKCLAGLGFAPAARAAARRQAQVTTAAVVAPAAHTTRTARTAGSRGALPVDAGAVTSATPPGNPRAGAPALPAQKARISRGTGRRTPAATRPAASGPGAASAAPSVPGARRRTDVHVPAPRTRDSRSFRRMAGGTLPPTMKQRIRAEAHGATPSSRSLPVGLDALELAGMGALASVATSGTGRTRAELALCA
ncbi:DUF6344 domain-containing protein [Actinacidiphila yeochonensis]|uniref:DUF6344 domain-containing protein n=1 Tax=Actinacidiphila yeochonensis TaxID=89050 RepID=UPI00068E4714|nr:DUF6344 domain-containing protein [Actinacidiphila yeochonensis]